MKGENMTVFGGVSGGRAQNDLWILNTKYWKWTQPSIGGNSPSPRMDHTETLVEDHEGTRIYYFGGFDGSNALGDLHVLITQTWSQVRTTHTCCYAVFDVVLSAWLTSTSSHFDCRKNSRGKAHLRPVLGIL